jgi:hypothetical protein
MKTKADYQRRKKDSPNRKKAEYENVSTRNVKALALKHPV